MSGWWERNYIDLLIATPISAAENVYYEWTKQTVASLIKPEGLRIEHLRFPEPCIDIVRDRMVNQAQMMGAKWLFMLDADVIPPPDVIPRLLAHKKEVVGGLYVRRHNPPFNEMLRFRTDGIVGLRPIMDGEYRDGELVECDALGTGCVLFDVEVFDRIRPFQMTINGQPARGQYFLWTESRLPGGMSEDFSAFVNMRNQGIPVFCDTSLKCRHLGPVKFVPSGRNELMIEWLTG